MYTRGAVHTRHTTSVQQGNSGRIGLVPKATQYYPPPAPPEL
eukprot:CAMPEP_0174383282 /NCGR_PEP_ID=MMETSP0811_2-20130205/125126_1 /TAXON_ID=73025 ORGANISM="Eutreptiella gymnastica-like, Strain CCMP1594" /NCGR_SAMPLE_ID=MMETSP0811_2 /ASSEMBLY_ACC=CAM_ASM_000667 /LENGTH=41 /DNA_ID= /DNA_START= /DNA_END= /DNA_ORIENTATION=